MKKDKLGRPITKARTLAVRKNLEKARAMKAVYREMRSAPQQTAELQLTEIPLSSQESSKSVESLASLIVAVWRIL